MGNKEDFNVVVASAPDEATVMLTVGELAAQRYEDAIRRAISEYDPKNSQYGAVLKISSTSETLTPERLSELAVGLQSDLSKILTVNGFIQTYINKDDLMGVSYDAIAANVNTEFKCDYPLYPENRNKAKAVENARRIIDDFNTQINVRELLRTIIPLTYAEGTYICYLRQKAENYVVDYFPLGIAEISDYTVDGHPVVLIDMQKLKTALSKTMLQDRKRKPLFFKNQEEEIRDNYPEEVYAAYKNGDTYAKLDVWHTGVIRIGNMNRKYGVSPLFRALRSALMLETFDNADRVNAKAKAKKIIAQYLNDKLLGPNGDRNGYQEQAYAHDNLMRAWGQPTVLVTAPPYVKSIEYVEPKTELTNIDTVRHYRNREMAALGIGFLNTDGTQTISTANISLDQMMKNIRRITEQIEDVLNGWYRLVLADTKLDLAFCPKVSVRASEMMSMEMKRSLAQFLFTTLNCSYDTAYATMGYHIEDEKLKRERENEAGFDAIFSSHGTAYNSSGDGSDPDASSPGRPAAKEQTDKQLYDKARNDSKK